MVQCLSDFIGMYLGWVSFKFVNIVMISRLFCFSWIIFQIFLKIFFSETTWLIILKFCGNVFGMVLYQFCSIGFDWSIFLSSMNFWIILEKNFKTWHHILSCDVTSYMYVTSLTYVYWKYHRSSMKLLHVLWVVFYLFCSYCIDF